MTRVVVDASVAVKWLLPPDDEDQTDLALAVLCAFRDSRVDLIQPPHWLAEVGAVLARLRPDIAATALQLFDAMNIPILAGADIYVRGVTLAAELDHHLFDTLYHAVALCSTDTTLITADLRYYRKAKRFGAISTLAEFAKA